MYISILPALDEKVWTRETANLCAGSKRVNIDDTYYVELVNRMIKPCASKVIGIPS